MAKRTEREMSDTAKSRLVVEPISPELRCRFGEKARAARRHRGLTQMQVSEMTGITQNTVSRIELGKTNLSLNQMERIARVVDHSVWHLLEPGPYKPIKE